MLHRDDVPNITDPDCWGVVGGHSEEGETPEETLKREVLEEIGITIQNPEFLRNIDDNGENLFMYHVGLNDEDLESLRLGDEGQEMDFFNLDDLKNLKLTKSMNELIRDQERLERVSQRIGLI